MAKVSPPEPDPIVRDWTLTLKHVDGMQIKARISQARAQLIHDVLSGPEALVPSSLDDK